MLYLGHFRNPSFAFFFALAAFAAAAFLRATPPALPASRARSERSSFVIVLSDRLPPLRPISRKNSVTSSGLSTIHSSLDQFCRNCNFTLDELSSLAHNNYMSNTYQPPTTTATYDDEPDALELAWIAAENECARLRMEIVRLEKLLPVTTEEVTF